MSLNLIALVISIILIISRLPGVIWPKKTAALCNTALDNLYFLKVLGIVLLATASYILFIILKKSNLLEIIMIFISVVWLIGGAYVILKPERYRKYGKFIIEKSELSFRILSSLVIILGILLTVFSIIIV